MHFFVSLFAPSDDYFIRAIRVIRGPNPSLTYDPSIYSNVIK
jgi:hypothetical protein